MVKEEHAVGAGSVLHLNMSDDYMSVHFIFILWTIYVGFIQHSVCMACLTILKYFTHIYMYAHSVETIAKRSCFWLYLLLLSGDNREGITGLHSLWRIMWSQFWCWGDTELNKSPRVQRHLLFPPYFNPVLPLKGFSL